jgi:hypothetical protein
MDLRAIQDFYPDELSYCSTIIKILTGLRIIAYYFYM